MGYLRDFLKDNSRVLYESLEKSWETAFDTWLPAVNSNLDTYNSYPHLRNLEVYADKVADAWKKYHKKDEFLSPLETYILLASILFHDIGKSRGGSDHGINSGKIIKEHWALLGIPNEELGYCISRICIFHDYEPEIAEKEILKLSSCVVDPFGAIREREIAAILMLIDHIDGSFIRIVPDIIREDKEKGILGAFRKKIRGIDIDIEGGLVKVVLGEDGWKKELNENVKQLNNDDINYIKKIITINNSLYKNQIESISAINIQPRNQIEKGLNNDNQLVLYILSKSKKKIEYYLEKIKFFDKKTRNKILSIYLKDNAIDIIFESISITKNICLEINNRMTINRIRLPQDFEKENEIKKELKNISIPSIIISSKINRKYYINYENINKNILNRVKIFLNNNLFDKLNLKDGDKINWIIILIILKFIYVKKNHPEEISITCENGEYPIPATISIEECEKDDKNKKNPVPNEIILAVLLGNMLENVQAIEPIQSTLASIGLPIRGWLLEYKDHLYDYFGNETVEPVFTKDYLVKAVSCMWNLSTQIFGYGVLKYETLAAEMREPNIEKAKRAVKRISIISQRIKKTDEFGPAAIWYSDKCWRWNLERNDEMKCICTTLNEIRNEIISIFEAGDSDGK